MSPTESAQDRILINEVFVFVIAKLGLAGNAKLAPFLNGEFFHLDVIVFRRGLTFDFIGVGQQAR